MDINIICIFRRIYFDDFNRAIVIHVPFCGQNSVSANEAS